MNVCTGRTHKVALCLAWVSAITSFSQAIEAQEFPPLYHDHYIAGGSLAPDVSMDDSGSAETTGLARSIRIDGVESALTESGVGPMHHVDERGIVFSSQWETASYGTWSADLAVRANRSDMGTVDTARPAMTLVERGMPFDGAWSADAGLGDLNAPNINLARFQSRFYLPTGPMQGLSTEWRGPSGLQIVAGAGEPGIYEGIKVPAFDTLGGSVGTIGAQWSPQPQWAMGAELAEARDVGLFANALFTDPVRTSSTAGLLSTAWQGQSSKAQLNVIDGTTGAAGNSFGTWLDCSDTQGRISQNFGVFRIDPNLGWADQFITNDIQGGYYHLDYQSRRWYADLGIDQARPVSRFGANTTFLTGDARFQLARDLGLGGVVNSRGSDGAQAWSVESYVDDRNAWGIGRGQVNFAKDNVAAESSFTLSQAWDAKAGARLSTSLTYGRFAGTTLSSLSQSNTAATLSVTGGGDLTSRVSVDANVRWGIALSGAVAPAILANVAVNWQMTPNWAMVFSYYENRVRSWTDVTVSSPLAPPLATLNPALNQRGAFLTIRYQRAAGQHFAPLGGAPGSGSGRLTGTIYLDANDNGRFDAGEDIAANVTVVLDGRYSTRSDNQGRFDFPVVAAGHHVLRVESDNLPLPWVLADFGRIEVNVRTRDHTDVGIAARRQNLDAPRTVAR